MLCREIIQKTCAVIAGSCQNTCMLYGGICRDTAWQAANATCVVVVTRLELCRLVYVTSREAVNI